MTDLIELLLACPGLGAGTEGVGVCRIGGTFDVERQLERVGVRPSSGAVDPEMFAELLATEFDGLRHGRSNGVLAVISLPEVATIRRRLGDGCVFDLITEVTKVTGGSLSARDLYHISEDGELVVLARDRRVGRAIERIDSLCASIAERRFRASDDSVTLTACAGIVTLRRGLAPTDALRRAGTARFSVAAKVARHAAHRTPATTNATPGASRDQKHTSTRSIARPSRIPVQVLAVFLLGLMVPILTYLRFDVAIDFGLAEASYLAFAGMLALAATMIARELVASVRMRRSRRRATPRSQPAVVGVESGADVAGAIKALSHATGRAEPGLGDLEVAGGRVGVPTAPESARHTVKNVEAVVTVKIVEGGVLARRVPTLDRGHDVSRVVAETATSGTHALSEADTPILEDDPSSAKAALPQRSPGASLAEPKRGPAITEHGRLTLRPGQSGGLLVRSTPEVFVREYERSTRYNLAALEGMRRSPERNSL